ncbi:MAG TPA: carbon storage regulator CsrA [Ignavibacteriaceae bacterium]|nr:carbon storage regulator CsrA [Ignavibacteriaceae bacterium]
MLILTRKIDEEIKIGSEISIKVLSISEGQVKLGIAAPNNVEIFRGEIYQKIKQVTIEALQNSSNKPKDISKLRLNNIRKLNNES